MVAEIVHTDGAERLVHFLKPSLSPAGLCGRLTSARVHLPGKQDPHDDGQAGPDGISRRHRVAAGLGETGRRYGSGRARVYVNCVGRAKAEANRLSLHGNFGPCLLG